VFELPIPNRNEFNKAQIQMKIIETLDYFDKINPDMDYFFIETKEDLIKYLEYPNPHKTLTIKEKDDVMSRCKKIINYSRNNYFLMPSSYLSFDDVYTDGVHISKHGGIPSVRKAIELLNKDPKLAFPIEVKVPKRVVNQIKKKKKIKQSNIPLYIKRGKFVILFD
jgi:mRNA degradation ribonuclease J1/J2